MLQYVRCITVNQVHADTISNFLCACGWVGGGRGFTVRCRQVLGLLHASECCFQVALRLNHPSPSLPLAFVLGTIQLARLVTCIGIAMLLLGHNNVVHRSQDLEWLHVFPILCSVHKYHQVYMQLCNRTMQSHINQFQGNVMFSMYLTIYYIFYKAAILSNFPQDVKFLQVGNSCVIDIHTVRIQ